MMFCAPRDDNFVEAGTESYKRDKAKASSARQNDTREEQSKLKS